MTNDNNFDNLFKKSTVVTKLKEPEIYDDYLKMKFTAKKIAFKIFYALDENNISIEQLIEKIQESSEKVNQILEGESNPDMLTLVKIEDYLCINLFDKEINSPYNSFYQQRVLTIKTKRELNNRFYQICDNTLHNDINIRIVNSRIKPNKISIGNKLGSMVSTSFDFEY